jgi:hypothetical protein
VLDWPKSKGEGRLVATRAWGSWEVLGEANGNAQKGKTQEQLAPGFEVSFWDVLEN